MKRKARCVAQNLIMEVGMAIELVPIYIRKNASGFYYTELGAEEHFQSVFRVWVNKRLLKFAEKDEEGHPFKLKTPLPAVLIQTEKKNWVLRPSEHHLTFHLYLPAGYRGEAWFFIKDYTREIEYLDFPEYESPRGALGIHRGMLISIPRKLLPVRIEWERTGRLYGKPSEGVVLLTEDGVQEALPEDEELQELLG